MCKDQFGFVISPYLVVSGSIWDSTKVICQLITNTVHLTILTVNGTEMEIASYLKGLNDFICISPGHITGVANSLCFWQEFTFTSVNDDFMRRI